MRKNVIRLSEPVDELLYVVEAMTCGAASQMTHEDVDAFGAAIKEAKIDTVIANDIADRGNDARATAMALAARIGFGLGRTLDRHGMRGNKIWLEEALRAIGVTDAEVREDPVQ